MNQSLPPPPGLFQEHGVIPGHVRKDRHLEPLAVVKAALIALVGLVCFCGCMHQYLLKLNNGDELLALTKPKLQGTNYFYTNRIGSPCVIPQSYVAKIRAVNVVEEKPKPASPPPKPKHWYFLWLA
jgi:hypothetical protein